MKPRLITAAILVPLVVAAIWWLPQRALAWLLVAVFSACAWEYSTVNRLGSRPWVYAALIAGASVAALGLVSAPMAAELLLLASVATVAIWVVGSRLPMDRRAGAAAIAGFGVAYFVVAIQAMVTIRVHGPQLLLLLVAIVALGDSAAYYVGRAFGQRKLAPVLSPNKTWVGFAASLASAILVCGVWAVWRGLDVPAWLLIGLVTNLGAQGGDLLESAFKRRSGVKDSGDLLPGHGGIWDRIDAILLAAPAFAVLLPK